MSENWKPIEAARDLRAFGWAPGDYAHWKCKSCPSVDWWKGDKAAWNCKRCAERLAAEHDEIDYMPFSPLPTPEALRWHDITTAPMDSTDLLLFDQRVERIFVGRYGPVEQGRRKAWFANVHSFVEFNPTHWMPLPSPPA